MVEKFKVDKDGRSVMLKDKSKKEGEAKPADAKKDGGNKKKGEK